MKALIKWVIELIARIHDKILTINDNHSAGFSDKQLHMIVFCIITLAVFAAVNMVFTRLAKKRITIISWIYTATFVAALAFMIEAGQYISNTGKMEVEDLASGMWGILGAMCIYLFYRMLKWVFNEYFSDGGDR